jgi:hypothetical protein
MQKFILQPIVKPEYQLVIPNNLEASASLVISKVAEFIQTCTKQKVQVEISVEVIKTTPVLQDWSLEISVNHKNTTITIKSVNLKIQSLGVDY